MTDRIRVTMAVDLFIDDEQAMREKAFATLRDAWDSEDEFPYSSASDVPLAQVVHSVLAAALPLGLPGGRRGQLEVDAGGKQSVETSEDQADETSGDASDDTSGDDSEPDADSDAADDSGGADRPEESDDAAEERDRPEEP